MNTKPTMECPACKEIEFKHVDTLVGEKRTTLEYQCVCGEVGFFDAPLPEVTEIGVAWSRSENTETKYPGFNEFLVKIPYDDLDELSLMDALKIAFLGGRVYEAERDMEALKNLDLTDNG